MNKIQLIELKKAANYSTSRVNCANLICENFVGIDNLLQNRLGKTDALYTPKKGYTTGYSESDILIGNIRPYLKKIWYATNHGGSSADVLTLRVNQGFDPKFVYYALLRDDFFSHMMKGSKGTKMPRGDKNRVLEFLIPDFSLDLQKNISSVLSSLDSKIDNNNKMNTELEDMAKTIYDYWFIQFDFPDKNGKPYKSSGGEMEFCQQLKREIPRGWEANSINTKIKIGSGFPFDSGDYSREGKYKVVTIKNVQDESLNTSTIDKIDFIPKNMSSFCKLEVGDVLMSLTGNVGRMCFVDQENLLLNQRVGKLLGEKNFIIYAYLFFKRPESQKRLNKIAGGSSQSNLSPVDAVKDYFVIPPDDVINSFSRVINPIFDQIVNNKTENRELSDLRDWLLSMLMNGQIGVK